LLDSVHIFCANAQEEFESRLLLQHQHLMKHLQVCKLSRPLCSQWKYAWLVHLPLVMYTVCDVISKQIFQH